MKMSRYIRSTSKNPTILLNFPYILPHIPGRHRDRRRPPAVGWSYLPINTWSWSIFAPPQTPFPGARDSQNLISWRWSLPTNPIWWGSMHAISSYRGNRSTDTQTHRQGRLQYTAPHLERSVINVMHARVRNSRFYLRFGMKDLTFKVKDSIGIWDFGHDIAIFIVKHMRPWM